MRTAGELGPGDLSQGANLNQTSLPGRRKNADRRGRHNSVRLLPIWLQCLDVGLVQKITDAARLWQPFQNERNNPSGHQDRTVSSGLMQGEQRFSASARTRPFVFKNHIPGRRFGPKNFEIEPGQLPEELPPVYFCRRIQLPQSHRQRQVIKIIRDALCQQGLVAWGLKVFREMAETGHEVEGGPAGRSCR